MIRGVAAFIAVVFLGLTFAQGASAGYYEFNDCDGTWRGEAYVEGPPYGGATLTNRCAQNGEMALTAPAMTNGQSTSIQYRMPSGSGFVGWRFWWNAGYTPGASRGYFVNNDGGAQTMNLNAIVGPGPFVHPLSNPPGQYETTTIPRQIFRASIECQQANCGPTSTWWGGISLYQVKLKIEDYTNPVSFGSTGTLFGPGTVSGTKSLTALGLDGQSGVRRIFVLVNLQLAASKTVSCAAQYTKLRPCPAADTAVFNLNTAGSAFRQGETNYISTCITDYAESGTANTHCKNQTTVVNN